MCCRNTIIFHTNFPWMEMFLMAMSDYYWSSPAIVMHIPYWPGYPRHSPRQNINRWRQTFPDMWGERRGAATQTMRDSVTRDVTRLTWHKTQVHLSCWSVNIFWVWSLGFLCFVYTFTTRHRSLYIQECHSFTSGSDKKFGQFSQRLHLNF